MRPSHRRHIGPRGDAARTLPRARTQELAGLEQQLRQINTQIETLRQPCSLDKAVDMLRDDLAEIGVMLQDAMPRKAVEALEAKCAGSPTASTTHADTMGLRLRESSAAW